MSGPAALAVRLSSLGLALKEEFNRRRAKQLQGSLLEFVKEFWAVISPGTDFESNWHIEVICTHLEAVYAGTIKNLIINVPPGTSKSTLVSVMFPAWVWANDASKRFFGASYSEPLSIRDAMLCRDIIQSPGYQELFPDVVVKRTDNQKTKYGLTRGGWRMATSVGGRGTGEHPHFKIVDDPHNVKQSESDVQRQEALDWYAGTLSSRGIILNAATIVIMQRLHQVDLTGYIMAQSTYSREWSHIVIPMRHEPDRILPKNHLPFKDPRKREGELLWPKLFTESKVRTLEAELGSYRTAGQLAQRPAPEGGGVLVVEHFQLWSHKAPVPDLFYVLQSYDTAFTATTTNDPTACTVWGIGEHESGELKGVRFAILLDCWTDHMTYPKLRDKVLDDWRADYGGSVQPNGKKDPLHPARRADVILVEEKGSGISLLQDLRAARLPVKGYNPGRADKIARAHIASPLLEADLFYVLESKKEPGKPITWARPLIAQCEEFPNGEHDDLVDTFTQATIYFRDAGFLEIRVAPEEESDSLDYHALKGRKNPYA